MATGLAAKWRVRIDWPAWVIVLFVLPAAVVLAVPAAFVLLRRDLGVSDLAAAGVGFLALVLFAGVMGAARSRQSRRGLGAAATDVRGAPLLQGAGLRSPQPALDDAWFPYLVASGLDGQVRKWFRAYPAGAAAGPVASGVLELILDLNVVLALPFVRVRPDVDRRRRIVRRRRRQRDLGGCTRRRRRRGGGPGQQRRRRREQ